jgi:ATP-dependent helicase/nuclease subunit B
MANPRRFFKEIVLQKFLCAHPALREKYRVRTRFLLGPAGSGKTFRCLAEIRAALQASPEGKPLILIAPKQATFQLERQLLADDSLAGYARLQIFSFERLADFVLARLQTARAKILSEEGRVMVLRALLSQNKNKLKIFRASSQTSGFAQQLSLLLRELQRHQLSPAAIFKLSETVGKRSQLSAKLYDLALLSGAYFDWLAKNELRDANTLLDLATEDLRAERNSKKIQIAGLWLDGFAEMTLQELDLLSAFVPRCEDATLAFCLDQAAQSEKKISALSIWSGVSKTFHECQSRLQLLPDCKIEIQNLERRAKENRFSQALPLRHLEENWSAPRSFPEDSSLAESIRLAVCLNVENEATLAAREILKFVRSGGRFRNIAVLLRQFDGYHDTLRRVFSRYDIPFFLDRRQSIAHHPLAELTRSALRLAAFGWEHDDFFCALKTGLVTHDEYLLDQLENEALARGWKKEAWLQPLHFAEEKAAIPHLEKFRQKIVPPFQKFVESIDAKKSPRDGRQFATAIRRLWSDLNIEEKIESWATDNPMHATVLEQMQSWLENIEIAFSSETLRPTEWLPTCEAGLSGMTAGIIPPALDQVLIGTIDRSRNPDLDLVFVLGLNESVFPATPKSGNLLTEADQSELSKYEISLGPNKLELLGRERFFGYIVCTRSRKKLVLTRAAQDSAGCALNPSPFFSVVRQLFPTLVEEKFSSGKNWLEAEHPSELVAPLIQPGSREFNSLKILAQLPIFDSLREQIEHFSQPLTSEKLSTEIAERLYGTTLKTSVSALEQFAACPFRFFVSAGLHADERRIFEMDVREKGSFQHAILAEFHDELQRENKNWRDISPSEARKKLGEIGEKLKITFRDGLFETEAQNDFAARNLIESLKDFIETTIGWMQQYEFDPHVVELAFGTKENSLPSWEIDLGENHKLAFRGVIDRVDLHRETGSDEALAVIIDYKSSAKQLDPLLLEHGLQLQLLSYLAYLRRLPDPEKVFGAKKLIPAGVFFVNLRGEFSGGKTRNEVLENLRDARQNAYRHAGRFDFSALKQLDNRDVEFGTQFNYRLKKNGQPYSSSREIMAKKDFEKLLSEVELHLTRMGKEIFSGSAKIDPYQKGTIRACVHCDYAAICRIDPWRHKYRILTAHESADE